MSKYLSKAECFEEIKEQYIARLGYISGGSPFIVPITYYYDESENSIMAFSTHGHKVESMRTNTTVCLYVDKIDSVKKWKSISIHGTFEELDKVDSGFYLNRLGQGVKDLLNIKEFKDTRSMDEFSNVEFLKRNNPIVYRIRIWDIAGRYMDN